MAKSKIETAVLIGAGNLGWHLAKALSRQGIRIMQVFSRTEETGKALAEQVHTDHHTDLKQLENKVDIIIIAIPDAEIKAVIAQIDFGNSLAVHTAGAMPLDVFKEKTCRFGVLYPLMTFTRNKAVDFNKVPVLVEANSPENTDKLVKFARQLSGKVHIMDSKQRKIIHLSAVFASNFSNHMYTLADTLLAREAISFDLLKPLITETAGKISTIPPLSAQTGPAIRDDKITMEEHLQMLKEETDIAEIYRQISKSIITFARKGK
ncbi:MAG: DUF2520 domain-containing protein [Bacteroidales bacterium]|nr:DUF2520 domain-containing protein [Bacteroidales bacterium]MBN2764268.1 DUF2520 domain-containing protein [Bacteroidales bacterium]